MALQVMDDSLLHFSQFKISFISQNGTTFIQDMCCHFVYIGLSLIDQHCFDPFFTVRVFLAFAVDKVRWLSLQVVQVVYHRHTLNGPRWGKRTRHCLLSLQSVEMEGNFFPSLHWRDIFASLHPLASGKKVLFDLKRKVIEVTETQFFVTVTFFKFLFFRRKSLLVFHEENLFK